jgi:hypothetical protein
MNLFADLSIILQGRCTDKTSLIVEKFRRVAPKAELIVSSWPGTDYVAPAGVRFVTSADPGTFPISVDGKVVHNDNLNRQVVSTATGLDAASRKFALKWRADFDFDEARMREFLSRYLQQLLSSSNEQKIVVSSVTTANPFAMVGLVFHVSDWFYLGKASALKRYLLDRPVDPAGETGNISSSGLKARGFPFGKFTAEQWMLMPLTRAFIGGELPSYNARSYRSKFLALVRRHLIVVDPSEIGLVTGKYDYFIYPDRRKIVPYIGHRLSSVTERDHLLLASIFPGGQWAGAAWLLIKGLIFRAWRRSKDRISRRP